MTDDCSAADPDSSACDDGQYCNGTETCSSGLCAVSTGDPCTGPDGDGDCAESCDETANACTANDPNATSCDDGDACTQTDSCAAGVCSGASPVVCSALDECHDVGSCDTATGVCDDPLLPDGTPCSTGTCQGGVCTPDGTGGSGTGGSGTGGSGTGGTTPIDQGPEANPIDSDAGCSCRVLSTSDRQQLPWTVIALLGLAATVVRRGRRLP